MSQLESTRDIARYFTMAGISVRPEASQGILCEVVKIKYNEERKQYLDTIVR
jgi:hypothetical protein